MRAAFYESPIGLLQIIEEDGKIIRIGFAEKEENKEDDTCAVLKEAKKQLQEYFNGARKKFNLPLLLHGTEFQKKVWNALLEIPFGSMLSYKGVSEKIGNEKACRAVGMANNKNPIMIVVPCHRVIGHNGKMVGYAGGVKVKETLLALEAEKKTH